MYSHQYRSKLFGTLMIVVDLGELQLFVQFLDSWQEFMQRRIKQPNRDR
jgi:hypothetical protein